MLDFDALTWRLAVNYSGTAMYGSVVKTFGHSFRASVVKVQALSGTAKATWRAAGTMRQVASERGGIAQIDLSRQFVALGKSFLVFPHYHNYRLRFEGKPWINTVTLRLWEPVNWEPTQYEIWQLQMLSGANQ